MDSRVREFLFKYRGKVPLPLLVGTFIWLVFRPNPPARNYMVIALGLTITLLGEAVRIWGVGYAGATTRNKRTKAKQLVTGGPYAYVRNPIYIGNFLISLGVVYTIQSPVLTVLLGLYFGVVYYWIVRHEESFLMGKFGEAYQDYRSKVNRFLPRLTPYDRLQGEFQWRELRKEYWTFLGFTAAFWFVDLSLDISNWMRRR